MINEHYFYRGVPGANYHYPYGQFTVVDETHFFSKGSQPSKIRVTLSRPLTWAEWEHLVEKAPFPLDYKRDQGNDFSVIHLTAESMRSRDLFYWFAKFISEEFVNVFPKAVLTKQEMK